MSRAAAKAAGAKEAGASSTGASATGAGGAGPAGSGASGRPERHAQRLLRWYPRAWRARYGEEFTALLVADIGERPGSWRRDTDVAWSGVLAHLSSAGLSGSSPSPVHQVNRCLATFGCAAALFLAFGGALWSQLTIGWQWSRPDTPATTVAMVIMSGAAALVAVLAIAAAAPIAGNVALCAVRRRAKGLAGPSALFLAGSSVLMAGAWHFGSGWPGTGGHPWPHQGLVPGGVAAFLWASTLSVSSYWAHPGALAAFPVSEVAWMAVSPAAMMCLAAGTALTIRRLHLSPRLVRYEGCLATAMVAAMMVFLGGACGWVLDGGPGPRNLFHVGAIDVAALVLMAGTLAVACRATSRARQSGLASLTP